MEGAKACADNKTAKVCGAGATWQLTACADADDCTADSCDDAKSSCVHTPLANGTLCAGGACASGVCEAPPACVGGSNSGPAVTLMPAPAFGVMALPSVGGALLTHPHPLDPKFSAVTKWSTEGKKQWSHVPVDTGEGTSVRGIGTDDDGYLGLVYYPLSTITQTWGGQVVRVGADGKTIAQTVLDSQKVFASTLPTRAIRGGPDTWLVISTVNDLDKNQNKLEKGLHLVEFDAQGGVKSLATQAIAPGKREEVHHSIVTSDGTIWIAIRVNETPASYPIYHFRKVIPGPGLAVGGAPFGENIDTKTGEELHVSAAPTPNGALAFVSKTALGGTAVQRIAQIANNGVASTTATLTTTAYGTIWPLEFARATKAGVSMLFYRAMPGDQVFQALLLQVDLTGKPTGTIELPQGNRRPLAGSWGKGDLGTVVFADIIKENDKHIVGFSLQNFCLP